MPCGTCGSPTVATWTTERLTYGDVPAKVHVCTRCEWKRTDVREDLFAWPVPPALPAAV